MMSLKKKLKPKNFFHCRLAKSLEGLNSSLGESSGELWSCKVARKQPVMRDFFTSHEKICCFASSGKICCFALSSHKKICCFALSSHKKICCFASSGINSKKLFFTLLLLYSHEGWTAALFSSTSQFNVNYTSATSFNCDATITFLNVQQWTASDETTVNIFYSASNCTQPSLQLTGLLGV